MKIKVKANDLVLLTKLSDDKFEGFHPNDIFAGYFQVGVLKKDIIVGERCLVVGKHFSDYLNTSKVTEIIDEETFKTENSTYQIIPYENHSKWYV